MSSSTLQRVDGILAKKSQLQTPPPRFVQFIEGSATQEVLAAASAELINGALLVHIDHLYKDNCRWSITSVGRIHPPVPWGSTKAAGATYGLERTYRDVLRRSLVDISNRTRRTLYKLDGSGRVWYLNRDRYPNREAALVWLNQEFAMDKRFYMDMWDKFRGYSENKKSG